MHDSVPNFGWISMELPATSMVSILCVWSVSLAAVSMQMIPWGPEYLKRTTTPRGGAVLQACQVQSDGRSRTVSAHVLCKVAHIPIRRTYVPAATPIFMCPRLELFPQGITVFWDSVTWRFPEGCLV